MQKEFARKDLPHMSPPSLKRLRVVDFDEKMDVIALNRKAYDPQPKAIRPVLERSRKYA